MSDKQKFSSFRSVPKTGVIYVMTEAAKLGFTKNRAEWANLGQGAPEVGEIENSPERLKSIDVLAEDHEYASIDGLRELREAVAELYNQRYRQGKRSQYTKDNVAISAGGRTGITRIASALGRCNVGHLIPDYTAYEELLDSFASFVSIPILLDPENNYQFSAEELRKEILGRGLSAILLSNPCNPTGKLLRGSELNDWVKTARELDCALIMDEFYSHYIFAEDSLSVSAAEYIEDVNEEPIIIVDGLTKNWRYPGFRVSWTLGPKEVIDAVTSAGSFLDGGCNRPIQRASVELLNKELADTEAKAIKENFTEKRSFMLDSLNQLGIKVSLPPEGSFYCWGDISKLPKGLNTDMEFFRAALQEKVIAVPGTFFDINPGHRRSARPSRFRQHMRFSFGPPIEELELGISKLKKLVN